MKPIVHYKDLAFGVTVGCSTTVIVVDHPRFYPGQLIHTSKVVSYCEDSGEFETLNTHYKPLVKVGSGCCGECC